MINGLLIVDKEKDMTSRDVVNEISRIFQTKKVGHTGTLDPLATGVLVLTIGKATKLNEIITATEKEYQVEAILGLKTDTLDITGKVLKEENTHFSKEEIIDVLNSFLGSYDQEVPIYSAVKINGRKLYEYARNNEKVDLPKRLVTIKQIHLDDLNYDNNQTTIKFTCLVSKGTYIRSLVNDIARKLGTVGTMKNLRRTKQGNYSIKNAYRLNDIKNNNYQIVSIKDALSDYYTVKVDKQLKFKIVNGQKIANTYNQDYVLFIDDDVLALYKNVNNSLKPYKMFI